jgi:UDP-glucose 4-epimerase
MSSATSMILVTGGAGYIGSHTVLALARAGRPVLVLDDLSTGHRDAVPAAAPLIEGTLADRALLADVFARHKISAILHFAARSIVGDSMRDPVTYLRENAAEFLNRDRGQAWRAADRAVLHGGAVRSAGPRSDR